MTNNIFTKVTKIFFLVTLLASEAHAIDPLMGAVETSASAMRAQSKRLKVISQNIANDESVGVKPGELPYQRKTIIFTNKFDRKTGIEKIVVSKYDTDKSEFKKRYDPNHPAADAQGYVLYPNVDKLIEKADALEAQRSYEANLNAIEITKGMINKTIDILR